MDARRLSALSGLLAVAVAICGILAAVSLAPWFDWSTNALSHLGVADWPERQLFNGTMLLTGLFGLGFLPAARGTMRATAHRVAQVPMIVAVVCVAGVGLFPAGHPFHFPLAITAYVGFIAGPISYGIGDHVLGAVRRGALTVASGVVHLGLWVAWGLWFRETLPGLAVPEFVGAVLFTGWVGCTAVRAYGTSTP